MLLGERKESKREEDDMTVWNKNSDRNDIKFLFLSTFLFILLSDQETDTDRIYFLYYSIFLYISSFNDVKRIKYELMMKVSKINKKRYIRILRKERIIDIRYAYILDMFLFCVYNI